MKLIKYLICIFFLLEMGQGFANQSPEEVSVYLFWGKGCPHCKQAIDFLEKKEKQYPDVHVKYLEIWENQDNLNLLKNIATKLQFSFSGLPVTIIGEKYFVGYFSDDSTGKAIESAILEGRKTGVKDYVKGTAIEEEKNLTIPEKVHLPLLGDVFLKDLSLPLLTIVIGALDGFNPCAMWVLLMLLSFLVAINDRKKLIFLGTLFIFTSAVVYYLFLVAWLNVMFFLNYIKWIKILIGGIAIAGGVYYLKEYFTNKESICKVTNQKQKQKIAQSLSKIVGQKRYWLAGLGIIVLAFFVNLIELVCSAGLPAIYTQILSVTPLSKLGYHLYLLLYTFVFMLDDLLVFMIAIFSLELMKITGKFSLYSHLIGGSALTVIGILLIFKPEWLMFG